MAVSILFKSAKIRFGAKIQIKRYTFARKSKGINIWEKLEFKSEKNSDLNAKKKEGSFLPSGKAGMLCNYVLMCWISARTERTILLKSWA